MTKVVMRAQAGALIPDEDEAREVIGRIPDGTLVVVEARQPRSLHQLRRWWKLCTILADNMPSDFVDKRAASDLVLIACHEADYRTNPKTGEVFLVPRSIAFESMAEDHFLRLWRRAVFYINANWLPIGTEKLEAEVGDFFAGPHARCGGSGPASPTHAQACCCRSKG